MKVLFLAGALMLVGTQAHASWAENANLQYPVFTGSDRTLASAQSPRYFRHGYRYRGAYFSHHRYRG
jgi:hypothetical protein